MPEPPERRSPSPSGRGVGERAGAKRTQVQRARSLRNQQTDAEARLWYHLRAHRFLGLKFKRQQPIGHFIVDFICQQRDLVIELDGGQHSGQQDYDAQRSAYLQAQGLRVLRFWNNDVLNETEAVLDQIRRYCTDETLSLSPNPSPARGRGERDE
ncbi:endonuclease domain-containing protein [Algiphilus sp.]|uniref:endonuclease domain-containing protein n=1 Tax=Algiphilus sp. TaxID=1872431 RepID=UPI003C4B3F79